MTNGTQTSVMVPVKKETTDAQFPIYKTIHSAAADLHSIETKTLGSLERYVFSTGLKFQIPEGHELQIRSRSGLAAHHGIAVLNSPGTIDADYRGEIKVILINLSKEQYTVSKGDRIAQAVLSPYIQMDIRETDSVDATDRDTGGLGSTGY